MSTNRNMFGKQKIRTKKEPARGVSFRQTNEFIPLINVTFVEGTNKPTNNVSQPQQTSISNTSEPHPTSTSTSSSAIGKQTFTSSIIYPSTFASEEPHPHENEPLSPNPQNQTKNNGEPIFDSEGLNSDYYEGTNNQNGSSHADEVEDDFIEPPMNRIMRRKSVFAEAYNPEEEEDETERIIHAKSDEQRIRLGENVKNIFLFRSLDHDQIGEVLDAMFERRVGDGEYVIKQGDDGDNFYVIESGVYNIFVNTDVESEPKLVGKYEGSGSFGELALMYNLPRAATIQATTAGSLWAMDRQTFRRIVLNAAYKKRKMYESLLEKVPMLKALQNYERMNLADALVPRLKTDGELIIKQGNAAEGMYFVEEGSCRIVMVNSDNQEKEISRVAVGGYFGELALVTKKPRAASVYAVGKVRLAFLDVEAFERLLGPCMEIMKRNIEDYENELLKIFGSQANISDIR